MNELKQQFGGIIREIFPGKEFKFVDNFDDINEGYEINLDIGIMAHIKYPMDSGSYWVGFEVWKVNPYNNDVKHYKVFRGDLPANEMKDPDYDFITKVLKNWTLFTF